MKRPTGFDKPQQSPDPPAARAARPARTSAPATRGSSSAKRVPRPRPETPDRPAKPARSAKPLKDTSRAEARRDVAIAKREARAAAAERKRYERQEVKRFTRRQRARRAAIWSTIGVVGAVVLLILVAIFSPILSLRTVTVDGTARVDAAAVRAAVEDQLGTPLALIDYGRIDEALRQFPVIRSYTTETIPPGEIAVHIVERQPIVSVGRADGNFAFVDAAGVTIEESGTRLPGVPLLTESQGTLPNPGFTAAVEVLLAMPDTLRAQVDTIRANTRDDVWLTLAGVTQAVKWGAATDSQTKVALLQALQGQWGGTPGTFDVSATGSAVFRPA